MDEQRPRPEPPVSPGNEPAGEPAIADELLHLQQELKQLRDKVRYAHRFLDSLPAVPWEAITPSLRFTYVGEQAVRLLGIPAKAWVADENFFKKHLYFDERERILDAIADHLRHRDLRFGLVHRMLDAEGHLLWVANQIQISEEPGGFRFSGLLLDITERHRSEEELHAQLQLLKASFDDARDGFFLLTREGRYVRVNAAGARLFGYQPSELEGQELKRLLFPEEAAQVEQSPLSIWRKGGFLPEYRMCHRSGEEIWIELTVSPLQVGEQRYVLGIKREITDRRQARMQKDERLAALHEQLQRQAHGPAEQRCRACGRLDDGRGKWLRPEELLARLTTGAVSRETCPGCEDTGSFPDLFVRPGGGTSAPANGPPPEPPVQAPRPTEPVSREPSHLSPDSPPPTSPRGLPPAASPAPAPRVVVPPPPGGELPPGGCVSLSQRGGSSPARTPLPEGRPHRTPAGEPRRR